MSIPPTADDRETEPLEPHVGEDELATEVRVSHGGGRRPRGQAARVVPVRLDPQLERSVRDRAQADGVTISEVIRAALRAWLTTT